MSLICFAACRAVVKNNMADVALRDRGTTSAYNCFPAICMFFKSKFFASVSFFSEVQLTCRCPVSEQFPIGFQGIISELIEDLCNKQTVDTTSSPNCFISNLSTHNPFPLCHFPIPLTAPLSLSLNFLPQEVKNV